MLFSPCVSAGQMKMQQLLLFKPFSKQHDSLMAAASSSSTSVSQAVQAARFHDYVAYQEISLWLDCERKKEEYVY